MSNRKSITFYLAIATTLYAVKSMAEEKTVSVQMPSRHSAVLKKYCFKCHDTDTHEGNVDLQRLSFDLGTLQSAEQWQKILNAINEGEMPPEESPQLSDHDKADFLADLSRQLVQARKLLSDSGGSITMRRLNRREYANTIRELLGVNVDVSSLPDDMSGSSFDTTGSGLFFSSDQLEKYLAIGRAAIDEALDERWVDRTKARQRVESEKALRNGIQKQADVRSDELRRVKLRHKHPDQPALKFGFPDDARAKLEESRANRTLPIFRGYLNHPHSKSGGLLALVDRTLTRIPIKFSESQPAGHYLIRVRIAAIEGKYLPAQVHDLELVRPKTGASADWEVVATRSITGSIGEPQTVEFDVYLDATTNRSFEIRARQHNSQQAGTASRLFFTNMFREAFKAERREKKNTTVKPAATITQQAAFVPFLWVDWTEWEGPLPDVNSDFRQKFGWPEEGSDPSPDRIRQLFNRFAEVVFRGRQPTPQFIDQLMAIIAEKEKQDGFDEALRTAISVILASPKFLYLIEPSGDLQQRTLTDVELANRLSYFLWSSPPDLQLLKLARANRLYQPDVLRSQTDRLLRDVRARNFVASFAHQWLDMERLDFFQFNMRRYPAFDDSLRNAARSEVSETIVDLIRNGSSIGELLHSEHVMVNDVLAAHYEIDGVVGSEFRRVKVPASNPRGGLLASAAVLAMGSDGERTSPVERGAWVLRHLLNDPPPPAPANVPQLNRNNDPHQPARILQKAHQDAPQCAQCHRDIDPIGFGLENFAADGRWRKMEITEEVGKKDRVISTKMVPIDSSGTLPSGVSFESFYEMRQAIAKHEDAFAQCLTEALISYGLGRPYGFSDQDLAASIVSQATAADLQMDVFVHALIQSKPFRTK